MDSLVIQWNCRSIVPKKTDLIHIINKYSPVVIALNETWLKPNTIFRVPGYVCLRHDRSDGYGGVAILIKKAMPYKIIDFSNIISYYNNVNITGIVVNNISIVSLYIPYSSSLVLSEINNILDCLSGPVLILGDFNSHHQSWGCSISNANGVQLLEILDERNLCVLNTGEPTRRTLLNENRSAIDLSICSPSLASLLSWKPLSSTFGSDHFPILINTPIKCKESSRKTPRCKYNLNNANWDEFKQRLENEIPNLPDIKPDSEINCNEVFAKIIIDVADQVFPIKSDKDPRIPFPPWWDKECTQAIKSRKRAEKMYALDMSEQNLDNFNKISKDTQLLLKKKKREGWRSFCSALSPSTNSSEVWKAIKRYRSIFKEQSSSLPTSLANNFMDRLASSADLNSVPTIYRSPSDHDYSILASPFSIYELKGVLSCVKDSAPGIDGIPFSFLSHLGDCALQYYLNLINSTMFSGNIPPSWKCQEVIPILKPNKPPAEATSYRPIILSTVLLKIAEHLIKNRFEWYAEHNNILSQSQFGFRKGRSVIDNISLLTTDIRLAFAEDKHVVAAFLDINSAYDNVNISILLNKLLKLQFPHVLVNFISLLFFQRKLTLKIDDSNEISRLVNKGLPQGSVLSPLLYNIYTMDLDSFNDSVSVLQYADDVVLYSIDANINNACNALNHNLLHLERWLQDNDLDISVPKSAVIVFSRRRISPVVNIFFKNQIMPQCDQTKFLGIILDSKLTGTPHINHVVSRCESLLNMLRCLAGVWWGAHPFCLKLIYNAIIRSVLDFGMFLLDGCNKMAFKKLDLIQSKALRIISGAMKSSPINSLQVECSEPPLYLRRQYLSDRFLFRLFQSSNHPLLNKLEKLKSSVLSSPYWDHKLVPCLLLSFYRITSIPFPIFRSPLLPIFSNKFQSLIIGPDIKYDFGVMKSDISIISKACFQFSLEQKGLTEYNHIYTDASKLSSSSYVGVGIFHAQYKISMKIKLPSHASVFTGECFGILKALEYVILMKLTHTIIFSDSKSALQSIDKFPFKNRPFYPTIFEIRQKLHVCLSKGYSVSFAWIPSHCGIQGNETADRLAKDAVKCGDMFPFTNYCHDLLSLPTSYLYECWNKIWKQSASLKGGHLYKVQPFISSKPWFCKVHGSKFISSTIIRMRIGHTCTPRHLARLGIVSNEMCECGLDIGDVDHIFFNCPLLDHTDLFSDLISLHVPFPTRISCLLYNPTKYYSCLSSFILSNNIKL